jgi:hypothetical protein
VNVLASRPVEYSMWQARQPPPDTLTAVTSRPPTGRPFTICSSALLTMGSPDTQIVSGPSCGASAGHSVNLAKLKRRAAVSIGAVTDCAVVTSQVTKVRPTASRTRRTA